MSTTRTHDRLDELDIKILDVIQRNSPLSSGELASLVGLSQSPCWRRVTRLKDEGYILDPVTRLNPERLGFTTTVFAYVKLSAHGRANLNEFTEAIGRLPEVVECHVIMGPFDFLLRVVTRNAEDYRSFVFGRLSTLPGVHEIQSMMSLGATKSTTALPIRNR